MPEQLKQIVANLRELGPKRLAIAGLVVALVLVVLGIGSFYLNRPAYETLYVGLERSDVNQIGMVLGESGVSFDVGSDGTSVLVPTGMTAQARMLLAEKGLPSSTNAGYELFDNVGSLGLTSFMQEVTRVRALEGEIARTIQSIAGIKAARVHIVVSERANFRRDEQEPSASVVIRYSGIDATKTAMSIRHLVAAAVPGLAADKVTVLDSNGSLLAAGDDPANSTLTRTIGVERTIESQIEDNIHRALAPYLGSENLRTSVRADVNTDSRQIEETIFDPESRVERSVQVVRANDSANRSSQNTPATVQQDLPNADTPTPDGPQSSEQSERKEETTNYEMNTKRIATVSNGYTVSKLSIAVVVNQERLLAILGADATPEQIAERVAEIQKVAATAAGYSEARGDNITVTSVEFMEGLNGEAVHEPGFLDAIASQAGTVINAAAFILVAFLVAWFGLRPLTAALGKSDASEQEAALPFPAPNALPNFSENFQFPTLPTIGAFNQSEDEDSIAELRQKMRRGPQERLAQMVDLNEERTAMILRKWANPEAA
ncbi:flagellar basal-body MS-ring/collar protein FliF [Mesorhizobium sp. L-8-3]|uniref:flagellar basal-body MS-ring/collar protein FliF n=1 Tax=Mesorhizobium sp. L-8-3 TaxID=2744522 RepID=UPI001925A0C0|nr:flagellar basal-body MS-ring/collar protein FliF [Mesorhizobium sp. L-8-3]BCH23147.1 flagellar M-ring protein [Mesorhizobium sp. L-8-3]